MEFWGVEVKSGEPLSVKPGNGMALHLSQANLGEVKKPHGSGSVCLFVNVDGKKLVLGTLNSDKLPQQQFDITFNKDFELSHNWKNGSVYFYGYKFQNQVAEDDDDDQEFDSDEDSPFRIIKEPENNVKAEKQAGPEKSDVARSSASDKKVKIKEPHKDVKAKEDGSTDDDMGSDDDDDDLSDEVMDSSDGEDEDGSGSEDDSDETPKKVKVESGKKRLAESAKKTPASDKNKKAKMETPQETGGKKSSVHMDTPYPSKSSVHVDTPYPSKQSKTAANKTNQQTPKPAGSHSCKSCNRTFGSEIALDSHTRAKHSSGK